ncbi:MAG: helix-turn-helix transcriptional regulator [Candidatus Pacearchaeota archaeon]|jgi:predicted transcriptional regulator
MSYRFNGEKFKRLLGEKGLTVHDMAAKLGIKYDSLYRKIVNINGFKMSEIIIILETLNKTFEEVFMDNE